MIINYIESKGCRSSVNSLYPTNLPDDPEMRDLPPYTSIIVVWLTMFEMLRLIPPQHPAIQKFVDLITELKELDIETLNIWRTDIRV